MNVNQFNRDGESVSIVSSRWIQTLMYCHNDKDRDIQNLFNKARKVVQEGNQLTFYDESGNQLAVLSK